jgi:hypothetical protein
MTLHRWPALKGPQSSLRRAFQLFSRAFARSPGQGVRVFASTVNAALPYPVAARAWGEESNRTAVAQGPPPFDRLPPVGIDDSDEVLDQHHAQRLYRGQFPHHPFWLSDFLEHGSP